MLTKPIGLGVISTAVKRDAAPPELVAEAVDVMTTLNAGARDAAVALGDAVHAATDVTGFGLLGHLRELLRRFGGRRRGRRRGRARDRRRARRSSPTGWSPAARSATTRSCARASTGATLPEAEQLLLADAQTSGGLLLAVDPARAGDLVDALRAHATPAASIVGRTTDGPPGAIRIV